MKVVQHRIATVVTFNKHRRAPACPQALLPPVTSRCCHDVSMSTHETCSFARRLFGSIEGFSLFSLIADTMTVRRGVKDTVALNLLENDWSSVVQWMYHRLRKRRWASSSTQSFLPPSLVQNNCCSHVLAFWQVSSHEEGGILRIFLCRRLDGLLRVEKDVHSFPVNHTTVSFTRAVHLVYRCLGGRLFSLSFIECIAAKLAYLELSNVFTLMRENTVWIVTRDTMTTDDNKLMVGARFMLDDFVQCFPAMHAYTMVNQFLRFVGDYSVDSTKSDDVTTAAGDYVSHIECMHERIEPLIMGNQDFITPHQLDDGSLSFSCNVCSHGNSPLLLGNDEKNMIHVCGLIHEVCYASRSFLIHYDVDSGTDHDVSQQELSITLDNMSSFSFIVSPHCRRRWWKRHKRVQGRSDTYLDRLYG